MRRYIVFENGEGWLVVDPNTKKVSRCTLDSGEATEMEYAVAKLYCTSNPYYRTIFPSRAMTLQLLNIIEV